MTIKVKGHRILLKPKDAEKVTKGGIVIPDSIAEKERMATTVGRVVDIGSTAFKDFGDGTAWCEVGDLVIYGKYGGKMIKVPGKDENLVILNDEDVLAVVSEEGYDDVEEPSTYESQITLENVVPHGYENIMTVKDGEDE